MGITRVRYREGQTLYHGDLDDEQVYRIAMRRRHALAHHTWGIVDGLKLELVGSVPVLSAGLAIDGYGRELTVPQPWPLQDAFEQLGCEQADVWLLYGREPQSSPRSPHRSHRSGQHRRWRELAWLRLKPAVGDINPRRPVEVSASDLAFGPADEPPDDPHREWPIYLGTLRRDADPKPRVPRPYAGLRGELLSAASERTRVQVGNEDAVDRRRFAVAVSEVSGSVKDRLVIDRSGKTKFYGDATLEHPSGDDAEKAYNLVIDEFVEPASGTGPDPCAKWLNEADESFETRLPGIQFDALDAHPEKARPWQIYYTEVPVKKDEQKSKSPVHQLRMEIANPGDKGDPARYLLAIGRNPDNAFEPCLSVTANCTVTVHGDLKVEGQIIEGPIEADADDPAFRQLVQGRWLQGLGETDAMVVDAFDGGALDVTLEVEGDTHTAGGDLGYSIRVTNTGQFVLSYITLYDGLSPYTPIDGPAQLAPGATHTFDRSYGPTEAGELTITALVLGVGPAANTVAATDSTLVSISEPPIVY